MNDQTIHKLDEAIRLDPENATAYHNRGYAYRQKGEYDKAIADYDKAIELAPEDAIAYRNRGIAYAEKGEYDKAIADYDEAIRLDPEDATAYYNRGDAYYAKDELDNARADLAKAVRLDPEDAIFSIDRNVPDSRNSAYFWTTYGEEDDYEERMRQLSDEEERNRNIAACTEAIRLDPKDAESYKSRGFSYHEKGNYDKAIKDYDEAIRLTDEDDSAALREGRGDAYYRKGDYDKAIEDYNQAIWIDPIDAIDAYMKIGDAHSEKLLNIDQTCKVCNDVIEANLETATAYHNKGYAYYRKGKYDQAIANYNEAIKRDPENSKIYIDRGDAYEKKCDIDVDAADYAKVLHAKKDIDMAISNYNEAIQRDPSAVIAYSNRGHAYLKKSDIELAAAVYDKIVNIDALNEAIQCNPGDAIVYFSRGYIYFKQGNIDLAIADYDNAIRLCPNYKSDFVDAGFVDGGAYAFIKVIELLENMIRTPAPENAADFYYCGLRALFSFRANAQEYFTKALNQGYEDRAKIEKHLENARKLGKRDEEHRERMRGRGDISGRRRRRRGRPWHRMSSAQLKLISAQRNLDRWRKRAMRSTAFSGERDRYKVAIANYNKTIQLNPKDAGAYKNRGYAYFQRGEYDKAIADYNKVIQLNPKDITAYFNKSGACYQKGCVDLHIAGHTGNKLKCALLGETIRFNPKSAETYIERGNFYFNEREAYDMAITDYTEAIRLSPEYAETYYSRAETYYAIAQNAYELTEYDDAIVAYSKAITDYKEAWQKGFRNTQNPAEVKVLRAVYGISPLYDSPDDSLSYAYVNRGAIYAKKGNYDLAIADMSEVIRHQRNIKTSAAYFGSNPAARAYNNRGFYHYKIGEYNKAIKDLQEVVNIYAEQVLSGYNDTPDFAIMYLNLGGIYHAKGDVELAIENYDNVIRLCPNYVTDFVNSKFAHGGQEEVRRAVKLLESVVNNPTYSESFAAYYSGVSILFSGNKHKARRRFEKARELGFKDDSKVAEHLENLQNQK